MATAALTLPLATLAAPSSLTAAQAAGATARTTTGTASCPWLNQSLPVRQRVSMLMAQMTLANKINMVTGAGFSEPYVFYISAIPSLCIPAIGEEDGPLGAGDGLTGVTQMPSAVSVAASFDTSLAYQYGQVVGAEERGKGAMVDLGPTVNIDRDPRWGRSFEAYTEDPYLNSALAVADIDGVQSQGEMAQIKHLAVYNQETNRNTPADNAIVSTRALNEIYLPAFWAGTTQAHAASVMCAYSTINGQAACQNQYLMQTLDQRWGFAGFVSCIFASVIGASLAAENDGHLPVAWTKPCSRLAYASAKMAVDLGAIAIVYALACAAVFIYLWAIGLGRELYAPSDAVGQFVRFLIAPAAFYGLLQALTATLSRGAGAVLGFTWVGLIALEALATLPLPAAYHAIFNFINNANPLVYISFDVDSHGSIIMVGLAAATTALALIAATGGAAAIYRWQRMEA